jgi:hypothetical protein
MLLLLDRRRLLFVVKFGVYRKCGGDVVLFVTAGWTRDSMRAGRDIGPKLRIATFSYTKTWIVLLLYCDSSTRRQLSMVVSHHEQDVIDSEWERSASVHERSHKIRLVQAIELHPVAFKAQP